MDNAYGLPGVKTSRTATPRKVLLDSKNFIYWPGGVIIRGALSRDVGNTGDTDVLRAGILLGKISSGSHAGKFAPSTIGLTTANYASGATSLTVSAATATEIVRRIGSSGTGTLTVIGQAGTGADAARHAITFSAVDTATGVITVSNIGASLLTGAVVSAADGSEYPRLITGDGYGLKVTDEDDADLDTPCFNALCWGLIDQSQLIGLSTDAETAEWQLAELNKVCRFIFDGALLSTGLVEAPTPSPTPTP